MNQQIQTVILIGFCVLGVLHQVELKQRLDAIQEQIKALRPGLTIKEGEKLPPWTPMPGGIQFSNIQFTITR